MYGDPRYEFLYSASIATNASGNQNFFGAYSGLSLLNNDDVIRLQLSASVNEFFLGPSGNNAGIPAGLISNNIGYKIYPGLSTIDIPPMRAGTASLLQMNRAVGDAASANNASVFYVIWRRLPL